MGVGSAKGADKAQVAAMEAISSPLLETSITGATGVLVSITASEDIQLDEIDIASRMIHDEAHPEANIIWGATFDPSLQDEMRITIIATGFEKNNNKQPTKAETAEVETTAAVEDAIKAFEAAEPVQPVVEPQVTSFSNVNEAYENSYGSTFKVITRRR